MATAMTTASRTTGVAPLAVHFDAVAVANGIVQPALVGGRYEYADLHYKWGFDDPTSGTWDKTDGASRNVAYGYVAWHVFETAGVYTVTLRVTELDGTITDYEQDITVTDPATVFAANTFYVANAPEGSDANPGTLAEPYETVAKAMTEADTACRILFKRGQTFTATATFDITGAGPGIIGAYGTGADPIIVQSTAAESGFDCAAAAVDWRIQDLTITGPGALSTGKGISVSDAAAKWDTFLALNITVSGFKQGFYANYWADIYDDGDLHDHLCFADCDFSANGSDAGGYGMWAGGTRLGLLGCLCNSIDEDGELHVRWWAAQKSIVSHCHLLNARSIKHALRIHEHPDVLNLPDSQYNIASDNYASGGGNVFQFGPMSAAHDETVRDCVIERNLTVGDATTTAGIWLGGPYQTARNNVHVINHTAADQSGIFINKGGAGPVVDGCRAVNNTTYRNVNDALRFFGVRVYTGDSIIASNNLASHKGTGTADAVRVDGGAGAVTQLTNYDNCPKAELTAPDTYDFTLVAGSSAINTGTTLAYNRIDRALTARPQGAGFDIGAYEFVTGGDVTPPTITAVSHADGSYITTAAINFDVTFSEPIVTPTAASIALTGLAAANAIVGTPSDQGGNKWRWAITALQSGALNIEVGPAPDTIQDLSENDLVAVDYDYTVDLIAPTVVSKTPLSGSTIYTAAVNINVNFSEAVTITGVAAMDLGLAAAASATVDSVTDLGGNTHRFAVSGLVTGDLSVTLAATPGTIYDVATNNLAEVEWNYTVSISADTTAPTIIARDPAASSTITTAAQEIKVTFDEVVIGVQYTDLAVSGSAVGVATVVGTPVSSGGGTIWTWPITGLVSGALNITLSGITDEALNALEPSAWSYTVTIPAPIPESSIVEQAVYAILAADSGVDAIVDGRVYWDFIPQNKPLPAIVINRDGIDHVEDMSGSSGLGMARISVDYFSIDRRAARVLAETGRQALQGQYGTYGGVTVQDVSLGDDSATSELVGRANGLQMVHVVTHEYDIAYEEAIPA